MGDAQRNATDLNLRGENGSEFEMFDSILTTLGSRLIVVE